LETDKISVVQFFTLRNGMVADLDQITGDCVGTCALPEFVELVRARIGKSEGLGQTVTVDDRGSVSIGGTPILVALDKKLSEINWLEQYKDFR